MKKNLKPKNLQPMIHSNYFSRKMTCCYGVSEVGLVIVFKLRIRKVILIHQLNAKDLFDCEDDIVKIVTYPYTIMMKKLFIRNGCHSFISPRTYICVTYKATHLKKRELLENKTLIKSKACIWLQNQTKESERISLRLKFKPFHFRCGLLLLT